MTAAALKEPFPVKKAKHKPRVVAVTKPGPGYEGTRDLVAAVVDDPYDSTKLSVVINAGGDPIRAMTARGFIDDAQARAAGKVRALHERAGAVGARAIDYTREHVDGGAVWVDVPIGQTEAARDLAEVRGILGAFDYRIVIAIAGEGNRVSDVAASIALGTEADRKYFGKRFRDALDVLVEHWGMATKTR